MQFQFRKVKRALRTGAGDGCTAVWTCLMPLTVHWEMVKIVNFMSCVFYENLKTINRQTLQIVLFLHSPAHNLNTENQATNNIIFSSLPVLLSV